MLDVARLLDGLKELAAERSAATANRAEIAGKCADVLGGLGEDYLSLAERIDSLLTSRLIARPHEPTGLRGPLPGRPDPHTVVAVDGSQIQLDRHETALCYVLNIGEVVLRYGAPSPVRMTSLPELYFRDKDLFEDDPDGERELISARRLATKRQELEYKRLTALIHECTGDATVALLDGTLIPWVFEAHKDEVRREAIASLEHLLDSARDSGAPVAGYISRPGSRDVVNLLMADLCGLEDAACGLHCKPESREGRPCSEVAGATDRILFDGFLQDGERSALFGSRSRILKSMTPENRILFFYLHVGSEVARVEAPVWVAEDSALLDRVHAVVYDQVAKGQGYPRALTEAHEQAVVRGPDRALFFKLLESALIQAGARIEVTRKALSKRTRSV